MAALATGLWSGLAAPMNDASTVGSVLDAVSMPPALATGHMALGQPGLGGGCGRGHCQRSKEMEPCHLCGQIGQQVKECDQWSLESAIRSVTCHLWSTREHQDGCHQRKCPRRQNWQARTDKSARSATGTIAQTTPAVFASPTPVCTTG